MNISMIKQRAREIARVNKASLARICLIVGVIASIPSLLSSDNAIMSILHVIALVLLFAVEQGYVVAGLKAVTDREQELSDNDGVYGLVNWVEYLPTYLTRVLVNFVCVFIFVAVIIVCMVGAGILSITAICVIDKLFFGKMAELGESCYFNTKQCVAAWLVLSGMINVMILFLIAGYLNYYWRVGLLQVGLYILTPYLVSSITALGILSMETRGKNSSLFGMSAIFLSISYGAIGSIPGALFATTLWIWAVAFLVSGLLFVMKIKKLLSEMEKGEVLCTN